MTTEGFVTRNYGDKNGMVLSKATESVYGKRFYPLRVFTFTFRKQGVNFS